MKENFCWLYKTEFQEILLHSLSGDSSAKETANIISETELPSYTGKKTI